MILQDGVRISEHECQGEFELLKLARDLNVANVMHALQPNITCLLDPPEADKQVGVVYFDMDVATGGVLRRYLKNHPREYISPKYVAWVGRQISWGLAWLHERMVLH